MQQRDFHGFIFCNYRHFYEAECLFLYCIYLPETEILFSAYLLLQFEFPWERITMIMTKLQFPQALCTYNNKQGYNTHSFWVPTIYQFGEWGVGDSQVSKITLYGETQTAICKSYRLYLPCALPSWSVQFKVLVCITSFLWFLQARSRMNGNLFSKNALPLCPMKVREKRGEENSNRHAKTRSDV